MNANASRRNKKGILVLMDVGFHYYHRRISSQIEKGINSLMEYEEVIPANVKILCLYNVKDFNILNQTDQKEYLFKLHFRRFI